MVLLDKYYKLLNRYSNLYLFKIADVSDLKSIIYFIDIYWKKNHALALSKSLMNWQHLNKYSNTYNFILAINKKTNEIHGLLGYIPSSQYDVNITKPINWGAIWKNIDDIGIPGLGILLLCFEFKNIPFHTYAALGMGKSSFSMHQRLLFKTGYCTQWYMIHPYIINFKLIGNYDNVRRCNLCIKPSIDLFMDCYLDDYMELDGIILETIPVYKSKMYYVNRFFKHPIYTYHSTKIYSPDNVLKAVFFWRFCEHDGAKCIRIVDYFGSYDALRGQCSNFQKLLIDQDAEFIDFINAGIDKKNFEEAGFIDRSKTELILANYYEPFLLENIDLNYAWYSKDNLPPLFFKGDADQDRPNTIE